MRKNIIRLFVFTAFIVLIMSVVNAGTKYSVFCAGGKIEVDSRTLDEMKSARGSDVCLLKEFDYSSDADNEAEKMGGKGASCGCK